MPEEGLEPPTRGLHDDAERVAGIAGARTVPVTEPTRRFGWLGIFGCFRGAPCYAYDHPDGSTRRSDDYGSRVK